LEFDGRKLYNPYMYLYWDIYQTSDSDRIRIPESCINEFFSDEDQTPLMARIFCEENGASLITGVNGYNNSYVVSFPQSVLEALDIRKMIRVHVDKIKLPIVESIVIGDLPLDIVPDVDIISVELSKFSTLKENQILNIPSLEQYHVKVKEMKGMNNQRILHGCIINQDINVNFDFVSPTPPKSISFQSSVFQMPPTDPKEPKEPKNEFKAFFGKGNRLTD